MVEVKAKTHLIVTDVHNEFYIEWTGKIADTNPKFKDGKPIFVVIGGEGRMEVNTTDMKRIEKCAKLMAHPRGRGAVSTDKVRIFIKEVDGKETLIGSLTHNRVKQYAPMYDVIGYKDTYSN